MLSVKPVRPPPLETDFIRLPTNPICTGFDESAHRFTGFTPSQWWLLALGGRPFALQICREKLRIHGLFLCVQNDTAREKLSAMVQVSRSEPVSVGRGKGPNVAGFLGYSVSASTPVSVSRTSLGSCRRATARSAERVGTLVPRGAKTRMIWQDEP